jgi:hypothetical protein
VLIQLLDEAPSERSIEIGGQLFLGFQQELKPSSLRRKDTKVSPLVVAAAI